MSVQEHVRRERADPLPIALRYREAAELIGVSIRQIHNLANAGVLKRVRLGKRCVRIVTNSAIKLIEE
jgi:predicted site-specific integrase-resolvase